MDKKKVLIVDDEVDFLHLVKIHLEKTNKFDVLTLSSAKDIVAEVKKFRPGVILLDVLMPVVGGVDACKILFSDPETRDIPVIILSALNQDKDKYMAYKEGVLDYIVKPVENDQLVEVIEKNIR